MNHLALVGATLREAWVRKTALVLAALALGALAFYAVGFEVRPSDDPDMVTFLLLGSTNPLAHDFDPDDPGASARSRVPRQAVVFFSALLAAGLLNPIGVFLGLFVVVSLFAAALEPGHAAWVLSKPVSRASLLLSRYAGGLLLGAGTALGFVLAMAALIAWKTGVWPAPLVTAGALYAVNFAVLAGFGLLLAVWTRSAANSLMLTFLLYVATGFLHALPDLPFYESLPAWARWAGQGAYHVLPKLTDLELIAQQALGALAFEGVAARPHAEPAMALTTSAAFLAAALGLALWEFRRRDL